MFLYLEAKPEVNLLWVIIPHFLMALPAWPPDIETLDAI
jgi:hypothetical protein